MKNCVNIVVVNNKGGAIFDFLPIFNSIDKVIFKKGWSTPQAFDIQSKFKLFMYKYLINKIGYCKAFNVNYKRIDFPNDIESVLKECWESERSNIIEISTNRYYLCYVCNF